MAQKKHTYAAEIDGNRLTRKTERTYSHAWASTYNGEIKESGFSSSLELAYKAGTKSIRFLTQAATVRSGLSTTASDYSLKVSPATLQ